MVRQYFLKGGSLWGGWAKTKLLYFEWSPPWHFKTATLDLMSAWSCQVRVDIQLISRNASGYSQLHRLTGGNLLTYLLTFFLAYLVTFCLAFFLTYLLTFCLTYLVTFFLTYLLTFFLTYLLTFCLTVFLTHLLTVVLTHLLTFVLAYLLTFFLTFCLTFFLTFCLTFFLTYLLTFFLTFCLTFFLSNILSGISSDILSRGWGPAGNTERRWSRLRSGREHWAQQVAVEVRHGTLRADGRGLCRANPAGNTGHGGSR